MSKCYLEQIQRKHVLQNNFDVRINGFMCEHSG